MHKNVKLSKTYIMNPDIYNKKFILHKEKLKFHSCHRYDIEETMFGSYTHFPHEAEINYIWIFTLLNEIENYSLHNKQQIVARMKIDKVNMMYLDIASTAKILMHRMSNKILMVWKYYLNLSYLLEFTDLYLKETF